VKGETIRRVRELLRESPVVHIASVSRLVKSTGYAYLLMNYLVKRGEARRITRGFYTIHEDPALLVYCLKPAYLGLQDAMSVHGLWEQETVPVVITCRKVRSGLRTVMGQNVVIRRISKRYFFGYDYVERGGFHLPVSDVEKTLIDLVHFGEMRPELAEEFRVRVNRERLRTYLCAYPERVKREVWRLLSGRMESQA